MHKNVVGIKDIMLALNMPLDIYIPCCEYMWKCDKEICLDYFCLFSTGDASTKIPDVLATKMPSKTNNLDNLDDECSDDKGTLKIDCYDMRMQFVGTLKKVKENKALSSQNNFLDVGTLLGVGDNRNLQCGLT